MTDKIEITDLASLLKEKKRLRGLIDETGEELSVKTKYLRENLFDESIKALFSGSKYGSWIGALFGVTSKIKGNAFTNAASTVIGLFGKYILSKYSFKLVARVLRLFA